MELLSLRRLGLVLSGALLAGVAATLLQVVGLGPAYAIAIGLSGAMPILLEGMRPTGGTLDAGSRLQRAIVEVVGALAVGLFAAFALVLAEASGTVLAAGVTVSAYVGGFLARSAVEGGEQRDAE